MAKPTGSPIPNQPRVSFQLADPASSTANGSQGEVYIKSSPPQGNNAQDSRIGSEASAQRNVTPAVDRKKSLDEHRDEARTRRQSREIRRLSADWKSNSSPRQPRISQALKPGSFSIGDPIQDRHQDYKLDEGHTGFVPNASSSPTATATTPTITTTTTATTTTTTTATTPTTTTTTITFPQKQIPEGSEGDRLKNTSQQNAGGGKLDRHPSPATTNEPSPKTKEKTADLPEQSSHASSADKTLPSQARKLEWQNRSAVFSDAKNHLKAAIGDARQGRLADQLKSSMERGDDPKVTRGLISLSTILQAESKPRLIALTAGEGNTMLESYLEDSKESLLASKDCVIVFDSLLHDLTEADLQSDSQIPKFLKDGAIPVAGLEDSPLTEITYRLDHSLAGLRRLERTWKEINEDPKPFRELANKLNTRLDLLLKMGADGVTAEDIKSHASFTDKMKDGITWEHQQATYPNIVKQMKIKAKNAEERADEIDKRKAAPAALNKSTYDRQVGELTKKMATQLESLKPLVKELKRKYKTDEDFHHRFKSMVPKILEGFDKAAREVKLAQSSGKANKAAESVSDLLVYYSKFQKVTEARGDDMRIRWAGRINELLVKGKTVIFCGNPSQAFSFDFKKSSENVNNTESEAENLKTAGFISQLTEIDESDCLNLYFSNDKEVKNDRLAMSLETGKGLSTEKVVRVPFKLYQ